MTGSAITIHLETYISRQVNISHFKAGKKKYISRQVNILHCKSAKHFSFQGRQTSLSQNKNLKKDIKQL